MIKEGGMDSISKKNDSLKPAWKKGLERYDLKDKDKPKKDDSLKSSLDISLEKYGHGKDSVSGKDDLLKLASETAIERLDKEEEKKRVYFAEPGNKKESVEDDSLKSALDIVMKKYGYSELGSLKSTLEAGLDRFDGDKKESKKIIEKAKEGGTLVRLEVENNKKLDSDKPLCLIVNNIEIPLNKIEVGEYEEKIKESLKKFDDMIRETQIKETKILRKIKESNKGWDVLTNVFKKKKLKSDLDEIFSIRGQAESWKNFTENKIYEGIASSDENMNKDTFDIVEEGLSGLISKLGGNLDDLDVAA